MNINYIQNPKQKILLVEEPPQSMREARFLPMTNGSFGLAVSSATSLNHFGIGHMTFCDGHIEEIKTSQLLLMIVEANSQKLYFDPTK